MEPNAWGFLLKMFSILLAARDERIVVILHSDSSPILAARDERTVIFLDSVSSPAFSK